MVIRLGQHFGFRTLNVVRRREQAEELLRLGGTAAIAANDESLSERVQALTGGAGVDYALDAVGGATGSDVIASLSRGGRLIVYGTLAGEPLCMESRTMMFGRKRIEGFWLSEWVSAQKLWTLVRLFWQIGKLIRAGVLNSEIGKSFPLTDIHAAIRQAGLPGRQGKVLLRMAER
jgi:NADPH:quinone reductase-like Zn-dependent oxidoreductase